MKTKSLLLATLVPLALADTARSQDFEGVLRQRMVEVGSDTVYELLGESMYDESSVVAEALADLSMDDVLSADDVDVETLVIYQKGAFMRVQPDIEGELPGYQIIDTANGTMWVVSPPERTYMEFTQQMADQMAAQAQQMMEEMGIDEDQMAEYEAAMEAMGAESEAGEVAAMGRTANVNGFPSSAYWMADGDEVIVGWCAEDDSGLLESMGELEESAAWTEDEDDPSDAICPDHLLEVRTVTYRLFSGELGVDEILSIISESVSDALFSVPEGYAKQTYPGMPGN